MRLFFYANYHFFRGDYVEGEKIRCECRNSKVSKKFRKNYTKTFLMSNLGEFGKLGPLAYKF